MATLSVLCGAGNDEGETGMSKMSELESYMYEVEMRPLMEATMSTWYHSLGNFHR